MSRIEKTYITQVFQTSKASSPLSIISNKIKSATSQIFKLLFSSSPKAPTLHSERVVRWDMDPPEINQISRVANRTLLPSNSSTAKRPLTEKEKLNLKAKFEENLAFLNGGIDLLKQRVSELNTPTFYIGKTKETISTLVGNITGYQTMINKAILALPPKTPKKIIKELIKNLNSIPALSIPLKDNEPAITTKAALEKAFIEWKHRASDVLRAKAK